MTLLSDSFAVKSMCLWFILILPAIGPLDLVPDLGRSIPSFSNFLSQTLGNQSPDQNLAIIGKSKESSLYYL